MRTERVAPYGGRPSHPVSSGGRTEHIFKFWIAESWAHTIGWIFSVWKIVGSVHRIRHTPLAVYLDLVGVVSFGKWLLTPHGARKMIRPLVALSAVLHRLDVISLLPMVLWAPTMDVLREARESLPAASHGSNSEGSFPLPNARRIV